jgi:hypothetical protein
MGRLFSMGLFTLSGNRITIIPALILGFLGVGGCERVALVGRDSPKLEPAEVVAEVERVDSRSKEIHLRPNSEGIGVIAYSDDTRVIYRGRELPADDLRAGDIVAMSVKEDSQGRHYSEFLAIRERRENQGLAQ